MKITDSFTQAYLALVIFAIGAVIGVYVGHKDAGIGEPIDVLEQRYNINCPLKFYFENDKLVVKSFSCTLNRKATMVSKEEKHLKYYPRGYVEVPTTRN